MTSRTMLGSAVLAIVSQLAAVSPSSAAKYHEPVPVRGSADRPVIILEVKPLTGDVSMDQTAVIYGGKVQSHDGEGSTATDTSVIISQPVYKTSKAMLSYRLDPKPKAGLYKVWTVFTVGGIGKNKFTISAGKTSDNLSHRLNFVQRNTESWKVDWQKVEGTLAIFPSDKILTVEAAGMAANKKMLDAFLLEPIALFPPEMTATSGELRSTLFKTSEPSKGVKKLYILEGSDIKGMDGMLTVISPKMLAGMSVIYRMGGEAVEVAKAIGIKKLPALVLADGDYKILGVVDKGSTKAEIERLFKESEGSVQLPVFPEVSTPSPRPFVNGSPAEWLSVGNWMGQSGISHQGIDVEKMIRPSADDTCMVMQFDTAKPTQWKAIPLGKTGVYVVESPTANYVWAKGTGHAFLYFKVEAETDTILHVRQSGIRTAGWLDGELLKFAGERAKPVAVKQNAGTERAVGRTDQGNTFEVKIEGKDGTVAAPLTLSPGWHRLMLKFVMQHKDGDAFQFAADFSDKNGNPLRAMGTVVDPDTDLSLHAAAQRLVPYMYVNNAVSLPHPGEALKLNIEFRNFPLSTSGGTPIPTLPLTLKLVLAMTDYDGKEIARREVDADLPGKVNVDFGTAPDAGYYAIRPSLLSRDGKKIIAVYPPDGFSVVGGTISQAKRKDTKKVATTYYFLANNPDAHHRDGISVKSTFEWMNSMGIYRVVGSNPGFKKELWDMANDMGIMLCADFWDIHNSETPEKKNSMASKIASYSRCYKSFNEVDINPKTRGTPEHWVQRSKIEYEAVKAARPDGFYIGGSLVRVGGDKWFENCLKLGLDKYQDAWDVHAYPQQPPVLGGTLSNSPNETELGVLNTYKKIGHINTLPFWIGETGAWAEHGDDARRWQAETVAKMVAWANSRTDVQVIGFLVPYMYSRNTPTDAKNSWHGSADGGLPFGHHPGEAALYTANALIDGLPYRKVDCANSSIQAGYFGETLMLWTTGEPINYEINLGDGEWLLVDVVGRVAPLPKEASGTVKLHLTSSPFYILNKKQYDKLTLF